MKNNSSSSNFDSTGKKIVKNGLGFGSILAMIISFNTYESVWLAFIHGVLGWLYVLYYLIF